MTNYSGKLLSEIQTKLCLAWFIARDTVPHTTAHLYIVLPMSYQQLPIYFLIRKIPEKLLKEHEAG
ncbi:hypothetical protein MiTa_02275 [Microcystis aeruginosa NIES-4264]|nr:hypothetical protein MiTa_02275 [Microcystis aeruginosa NIES-4264]